MKTYTVNVRPTFTNFDPIFDTPGTPDYVARAGAFAGRTRNSVVGRGTGVYSAGPVESFPEGIAVPSLPRRQYIPTRPAVEL